MSSREPVAALDGRFSTPGAAPTAWAEARRLLEAAYVYWLTTVRPDGQPHVAPLFGVWLDDALYVSTGPEERKAKNLAANPRCTATTGCNTIDGVDLVIEGAAVRVHDGARLGRLAEAWAAKYAERAGLGDDWRFGVRDGAFVGRGGNVAHVFELAPTQAFGFRKGPVFSQTRWRFEAPA